MDSKTVDITYDVVTGKETPLIGAEENRQTVERFLIEQKGFAKQDIEVDAPLELLIAGEVYRSKIDLIVRVNGRRLMAIKCAAGSLGSREREILAAARLTDTYQIPFSMVSDGKTAIVLDTVSGQTIGEGLDAVFSKQDASEKLKTLEFLPFPEKRLDREKIIFRSYDSMNVNVSSAA